MTLNETVVYVAEAGFTVSGAGEILDPSRKKRSVSPNNRGYLMCKIRYLPGKRANLYVHRFVAYLKYGDRVFEPGIQVRHLDNDKHNNCWDNIAIGTASDNMRDIPPGLRPRAVGNSNRRVLSDAQVAALRRDWDVGLYSKAALGRKYGVAASTVFNIVCGKTLY